MKNIERRYISQGRPELRDGAKSPGIDGNVAVYNSWSPVYYGVREQILPTFFNDVLGGDVPSLFNHDPNIVLGRTSASPPTLRLRSTATGLYTETDLNPESQMVRDMVVLPMKRGDIRGASFAFSLPPKGGDRWAEGEDGVISRELIRAAGLHDVSPAVTNPYYPQTDMALRALAAAQTGLKRKGAEAGDLVALRDERLVAILADLNKRVLSQKEMMLLSVVIGILEELLPDDDGDEEEEPAPAAGGVSLYSLFGKKTRRALGRRATEEEKRVQAPELPVVAPALHSMRMRLALAERAA
jgi:HK97 family phage prohead protease